MSELHFADRSERTTAVRWLLVLSVLVAAGCGDSADGETATAPMASADTEVDSTGSGGDEGDADRSGDLNTASVTVGDESFDFEWETGGAFACDASSSSFLANFNETSEDRLEVELWPEESSVDRSTKVEVGDWTADPDERSGLQYDTWPAKVDSFEINGNTATGTATFVGNTSIGEEPVGVPGTFEITCVD